VVFYVRFLENCILPTEINLVFEFVDAPDDTYFLWGNVSSGVSIEIWEVKAESSTVYPYSLDKIGLAMLTIYVNDLSKCRTMCADASIESVGDGALPNPAN
jgi:hypothetical protein